MLQIPGIISAKAAYPNNQSINHLNENPIDRTNPIDKTMITTADKIYEPSKEEVINQASKQLFAYISAKHRKRQKQANNSTTRTIVLDDTQSVDVTETK